MEKLLGEGTSFEDVEKLRKLLTVAEHKQFERQEQITDLTDELETIKTIDYQEIQEKQNELRKVKTDCEETIKRRKKELNDELKKIRHEMNINEQMKEENGFTNQSKWESEVKLITHDKEAEIPGVLEDLRQTYLVTIDNLETDIQFLKDTTDAKYIKYEAKIESKKRHSKLSGLRIKNLRRKLENRQIFAQAVLNGLRIDEQLIPNPAAEQVTAK
jgi:hypothetical protein